MWQLNARLPVSLGIQQPRFWIWKPIAQLICWRPFSLLESGFLRNQVRIRAGYNKPTGLHSAEKDILFPFNSVSLPCCQWIKINTNKIHIARTRGEAISPVRSSGMLKIRFHRRWFQREDDNSSLFNSISQPCCQCITIDTNKHVYHQSQWWDHINSGFKWAECWLIIGMGYCVWGRVGWMLIDERDGLLSTSSWLDPQ